eukprot:SM000170S02671  [mRNA]  locus=s170:128164:135959:+ [translate_table: standard]
MAIRRPLLRLLVLLPIWLCLAEARLADGRAADGQQREAGAGLGSLLLNMLSPRTGTLPTVLSFQAFNETDAKQLASDVAMRELRELEATVQHSLRQYIQQHFNYCIEDYDDDKERTFRFEGSREAYLQCQDGGLLTGRLCRASEAKMYFESFESSYTSGLPLIPNNKNCDRSANRYMPACEAGFASDIINMPIETMSDFVVEAPERNNTDTPAPCCEGFFCPQGLACMIPCPLGAYCPHGDVSDGTYTYCSPYEYQPKSPRCGGAHLWAVAWRSSSIFCPEGYFCNTTTSKYLCPRGHFCREGSTRPKRCLFGGFNCKQEGLGSQDLHLIGIVTVNILFAVLIAIYQCSGLALKINKELLEERARTQPLRRIGSWRRQIALRRVPPSLHLPSPEIDYAAVAKSPCLKPMPSLRASTGLVMQQIELSFVGLTLTLKRSNRALLDDISGSFFPGRMTAVMGPSGAGKTTFLATIAGKLNPGCTSSGKVIINGSPGDLRTYRRIIGFVPQDDIVHANLTVEENLWFSAKYRLPTSMSHERKAEIVERTVKSLGLESIRHAKVGSIERRGISGGQRKRVNVGLEMVMEPSLLILDEPTSGLDSTSSRLVVEALQREARRGVNVIVVLHQPSYAIFKMFDDLMLLARRGRCAYHGPLEDVEPYFLKLGFPVPDRINPPDFFIDVLEDHVKSSLDPDFDAGELPALWSHHVRHQGGNTTHTASKSAVNADVLSHPEEATTMSHLRTPPRPQLALRADDHCLPFVHPLAGRRLFDMQLKKMRQSRSMSTPENLTRRLILDTDGQDLCTHTSDGDVSLELSPALTERTSLELGSSSSLSNFWLVVRECLAERRGKWEEKKEEIRDIVIPVQDKSGRCTPGFWKQFVLILRRSAKQRLREPHVQLQDYVILLITGVAMGMLVKINEETLSSAMYPNCLLSMSLVAMIAGLRTFGADMGTFWRESASGINRISFFLAKDVLDLTNVFLKPAVYLSVFYFFTNPRSTFTANYIVMLALVYTCTGIAYVLSIVMQPAAAQLASAVCCLVSALISTKGPYGLQILYRLSFARWALEAGVVINAAEYSGVWVLTRCAVLLNRQYNIRNFQFCMLVLLLYGAVARAVALCCLFLCNRHKQR